MCNIVYAKEKAIVYKRGGYFRKNAKKVFIRAKKRLYINNLGFCEQKERKRILGVDKSGGSVV